MGREGLDMALRAAPREMNKGWLELESDPGEGDRAGRELGGRVVETRLSDHHSLLLSSP